MHVYDALLVVVAAVVSGAVTLPVFIAIDSILDTVTVWGYMAAVGMMIVCVVVSWLTGLSGVLSSGFGSGGQ